MDRMRMSGFLALAAVFCGPTSAQAGLIKIADNVYSYVDVINDSPANSFAANAGVVIGRDGVVVIDTLISAKEAQRFIRDIRDVTDKPIRYVVNTHSHLDHTFGNAEFAKLGAAIVAHGNCDTNLRKNGENTLRNAKDYGLTEEDMKGTEISFPLLTFQDRMQINLGDLRVELLSAVPSHTDDSILVFIPERKVLFTGDVVFTDFHPYMGNGDIAGWLRKLDDLLSLDVEKIIPGHGPLSGKKDLVDMKNYIISFDGRAKELAATSNDVKAIAAEMVKSLPKRSRGEWMIPYNLQMKYLQAK